MSDYANEFHIPGEYKYHGMQITSEGWPAEHLDKLKTFPFKEDDIVVATYPKAGK